MESPLLRRTWTYVQSPLPHTLNLGILAHIDAGKTSLTERLLHAAGVIDEVGRVDDGNTQTDSLALERRRGITIKSAVVSFSIGGTAVNLIDTPGHPDFIAEVERVLSVLDGAVLVVSAVEGVQAQTRVLLRTLRRLRIPTLVFVNKTDRRGARYEGVLRHIAERLTPDVVPMGSVPGIGTRGARFVPFAEGDEGFGARLSELLAEHDDALLAAYVDDPASLSYARLRAELARQTRRALVHPVFFGSAVTGVGVPELMSGMRELLPARRGDADAPASGSVFKVERGAAGEKIAYVRMFSGTVRVRDRLREGKVTGVSVFEQGADVPRDEVRAGQIGKVRGLGDVRIGDVIGVPREGDQAGARHFAPPTLETVVSPLRAADRGALHLALGQLAEQDPLIDLRQDDVRQEVSVSLYGEVQKEVIQATLAEEYGLDVTFRETTTICVERVVGTGAAHEVIDTEPNPFLATVGLRVEPAPVGAGVEFRLGVELGSMPYAFFRAVEETVRETLHQGVHGWRVPDCTVTMTHAGYWPRQSHAHGTFDKSMSSTAGDFRHLTPLVLMDALRAAGTEVHEPMHRFRLDVPADTVGAVLPALARLRAVPHTQTTGGAGASYRLEGDIPAQRVHALEQLLPGLTRGEGELESAFDHYRPVRGGTVPTRERTDHDPLHRKDYLLRVVRRTSGGGREDAATTRR
ncbi:GTP-binding protein [Streptomyces sp. SID335]|nr:GTP-binding protein [Streptomyces sp. SID335]MYZ15241.1 GTP-binding protein [Streptomyces sp. SID337]NDZ91532.1 TetM/TetW/TetO/TetS family tetracycline resistance ribosomal protection protein [Streptomyces sp. SID10115]NEA02985.1 TetM/TetW/TetO/TetS family tetracycline resistance ribosomal protection protein [Streptomyces sp. SID10116]NEB46249.1 TetM/TetW/TetO/TetS family tetracycline resistance ribosomal protection protein [Streptomyces sp. SID339]